MYLIKAPIGLVIYTYDVGDLVLGCWRSTHICGIVESSVYRMYRREGNDLQRIVGMEGDLSERVSGCKWKGLTSTVLSAGLLASTFQA